MGLGELTRLLLHDKRRLAPCDAVAAIIVVGDRYLLQLRDTKPGIFFPGHWGLFGGGIEAGESEDDALARELFEELGLALRADAARRFISFTFDFNGLGGGSVVRAFYEIALDGAAVHTLQLGEGQAKALLTATEIFAGDRPVAPYDAFALWLHTARGRLELPHG